MTGERVVLITGAASGIGAAAALAFADDGWHVALGDVAHDRLIDIEGAINSRGGTAYGIAVDVRDESSVRSMVESAVERFGGFDAVCPNAGIGFPSGRSKRLVPTSTRSSTSTSVG